MTSLKNIDYGRYPIRKITKGRLIPEKFVHDSVLYVNRGMTYVVGQKLTRDEYPIAEIVFDEDYFNKANEARYHIFLDTGSEYILWKDIVGSDITPEFDIYYQDI